MDPQVIHGDYGPYNLMVRDGHPMTPIDFELARIDWRLNDIISAFSTNVAKADSEAMIKKMRVIAQGYQTVNPLSREEWQMLPYVWEFSTLRRVIVCWDQYLGDGLEERIVEIQRRMKRFDWVIREHKRLETLMI